MGCDIHLYTEELKTMDNKQKWHNCDNWRFNPYYDEYPDSERLMTHSSIYSERDYRLFSILANVRNYHNNDYISLPKGLPRDISQPTRSEAERWGGDGHSHSYFTMSELDEYIKNFKQVKVAGYITIGQSRKLDQGELPNSWCQGISKNMESRYVHREWFDNDNPVKILFEKLKSHMEYVRWIFNDEESPEHYDKFRIVFWFDN